MTRPGGIDTAAGSAATQTAPLEHPGTPRPPDPALERPAPSRADRGADRSSRRRYAALLLLAVVVAIAVRIVFVAGDHIASPDETTYLTSGLNFWAGHGFTTLSGAAETHFPPGVPFLVGGIHEIIGGDPHTATLVLTLLTSSFVVLPLAGIARLIAGRKAAVLAAWIAALSPALTVLPLYSGGSGGPFTLLVVTALWLALVSQSWPARRLLAASATCGALVGAAYLVRPEGLFYAALLLPLLVLSALGGWRSLHRVGERDWRVGSAVLAAFVIPLALFVAPYVGYLHSNTGTWELTAKTQDVSIASWRAVASDNRPARHAIEFALHDGSYQFPGTHSLTSLVRGDPVGYLDIVGTNLNHLYAAAFNSTLTPFPSWPLLPGVLFLLAIFAAWRRRRQRAVIAVVAAIAIPVITAIAFFVLPRYLIPSAALAVVLVAVGLLELPKRWFRAAVIVTFLLVITSTAAGLYGSSGGWLHPTYGYAEHKEAGEWIAKHSRPNDLVMSTIVTPGFYANRRVVPTPYASQARIIDFARHYGVRYLIVDQAHGVRFRPQLNLLLYRNPWKTLRAVHRITESGRKTVIYKVLRPAPRVAGHPPLLTQIGDAG